MNTDAETTRPRRRWGKVVTRIVLPTIAVGLVVTAVITVQRYTAPERIRAAAEAYLRQYTSGRVRVGSASFSWLEGIHLFDVAVMEMPRRPSEGAATPGDDDADPWFSCREVELKTNLLPTALGRLSIETIVAFEPTCNIVRDAADGYTNLAGLFRKASSLSRTETVSWPMIDLRNAGIRVVNRGGGRERVVEDMSLTIRGRSSPRSRRFYDVVWHEGGDHIATGHSQIDLQTGRIRNVSGGLPWMSIEAVMIAVNAGYDAAGTWCDLLGLDGTVRATDFDLGPGEGGPRSATIELTEASLSIPINKEEEPLAPDQRYLRFDSVFGAIELTAEGIKAEFDGLFHGSACRVSATMGGGVARLASLEDVDLDVRVSVQGLKLPSRGPDGPPEEVRFVRHWERLAKFYRAYDPHGRIDLEIEVAKEAGEAEPINTRRVLATAKGTDASYRLFPYRVTNMAGSVEMTPSGVFINDVHGERNGGMVSVSGRLSAANRCCAADLHVTGTSIPIDDALVEAIPQRYRKIRTLFRPEGRVDIDLDLTRPACVDGQLGRWGSKPTIRFEDLSANYEGFPFPVQGLSGTITAEGDRLQVLEVTGRAGDAPVRLHGTAVCSAQRPTEVDLTISAQDVLFDDRLLSALPESLRERVQAFSPRGSFNIDTVLTREAEASVMSHASEVTLLGVTIRHDGFPVEIEDIHGRLRIDPRSIQLDGVTGQYHRAAVTTRGRVDYAGAERGTELDIECRGLVVDDTLVAAAPERLRETLTTWRVDGTIDTDVAFRTTATGDLGITTVARIDGAAVQHPRFPIPFANVRGQITFDEQGARATGVEAKYGEADVRIDFETRDGASTDEGTIALDARGLNLDHSLRDLLPKTGRATWDRIGLAGRVDLTFDRLNYVRGGVGQPRVWSVEGRAALHEVTLPGVVGIGGAEGTLTGKGLLVDRLGGTTLSGDLSLTKVDVLNRRLDDVESPWSYAQVAEGSGRLALDSIRGGIYEGGLTSEVELRFDRTQTHYNLSATVQGMNIEPFLAASGPAKSGPDVPSSARGYADGRLYLSGQPGNPSTKRGGGSVEIIDGHLYRLPIMLAILNVINLTAPDEDAFDDARADFHVVGNRIELSDIVLRGSALALAGAGSMSLPDQGLRLSLVSISPHDWARLPGLTDFFEAASRELVELQVTGPLSRPTVRANPLPGITEEIKSLFKKKKPKKIPPAPS